MLPAAAWSCPPAAASQPMLRPAHVQPAAPPTAQQQLEKMRHLQQWFASTHPAAHRQVVAQRFDSVQQRFVPAAAAMSSAYHAPPRRCQLPPQPASPAAAAGSESCVTDSNSGASSCTVVGTGRPPAGPRRVAPLGLPPRPHTQHHPSDSPRSPQASSRQQRVPLAVARC